MIDDITFQRQVRDYYRQYGRHDLPWRIPEESGEFDPYRILVSEIMLQQTQVGRVTPKFTAFLEQFPTLTALARASLGDVLRAWSGLGYNRRAKFLHEAAQLTVERHNGVLPDVVTELTTLPGVGINTAGAVLAYAFDQPVVFVETNIRTVFIHHYFAGQAIVQDKALLEVVTRTLPKTDIRSWYWALMDYGTSLKQSVGNLSRASSSYARQSSFAGSRRQLRGQIIRLLGEQARSRAELQAAIDDEQLPGVLADLEQEHLIRRSGRLFSL